MDSPDSLEGRQRNIDTGRRTQSLQRVDTQLQVRIARGAGQPDRIAFRQQRCYLAGQVLHADFPPAQNHVGQPGVQAELGHLASDCGRATAIVDRFQARQFVHRLRQRYRRRWIEPRQ